MSGVNPFKEPEVLSVRFTNVSRLSPFDSVDRDNSFESTFTTSLYTGLPLLVLLNTLTLDPFSSSTILMTFH